MTYATINITILCFNVKKVGEGKKREGLDKTADLEIFDVADEEEPFGNPGTLERRGERSPRGLVTDQTHSHTQMVI